MNKWRQTLYDHIFHLYWALRLVQLTSAHATSNIVWYICESVCLQYRRTEEWSWNLGPFHVNIWSELVTCKAYNWLRSIYSCCQCYLPSYTCTACLSDDWARFWAAFQTSIGSRKQNISFYAASGRRTECYIFNYTCWCRFLSSHLKLQCRRVFKTDWLAVVAFSAYSDMSNKCQTRGSHLYLLCRSICDRDQNWIK